MLTIAASFVLATQFSLGQQVAAHDLDTVPVVGSAELTLAEALESARSKAVQGVEKRLEAGAAALAERHSAFWLPSFALESIVRTWLQEVRPEQLIEIVDRVDRERDHGWGTSWQTTLLIRHDREALARVQSRFKGLLQREERRLGLIGLGSLVWWGLLFVSLGWLDRLSRGYMTGRLAVIGLVLGSGLPALAVLA